MVKLRIHYLLIVLLIEKIVQHSFVTVAFYFDIGGIRDTVAVPYEILMLMGMLVAILFGLSLWGTLKVKPWALTLITALAVFDIIGEFVAQGTMIITCTVSFLTAIILLAISLWYRKLLASNQ